MGLQLSEPDPNQLTSPLGTELFQRKMARQVTADPDPNPDPGSLGAELSQRTRWPWQVGMEGRPAAQASRLTSPCDSALLHRKMANQGGHQAGGVFDAMDEGDEEGAGDAAGGEWPATAEELSASLTSPMSDQLMRRKVARQTGLSPPDDTDADPNMLTSPVSTEIAPRRQPRPAPAQPSRAFSAESSAGGRMPSGGSPSSTASARA